MSVNSASNIKMAAKTETAKLLEPLEKLAQSGVRIMFNDGDGNGGNGILLGTYGSLIFIKPEAEDQVIEVAKIADMHPQFKPTRGVHSIDSMYGGITRIIFDGGTYFICSTHTPFPSYKGLDFVNVPRGDYEGMLAQAGYGKPDILI